MISGVQLPQSYVEIKVKTRSNRNHFGHPENGIMVEVRFYPGSG